MVNKELMLQAKVFKYELNNARHEYSFKEADLWVYTPSTEAEKRKLESEYYPVLFTKCPVEQMKMLTVLIEGPINLELEQKVQKNVSGERIFLVAHCISKRKH